MSQKVSRGDRRGVGQPESGFEALRRSPEFGESVEPTADHDHSNGHFAVIYETEEERFAATVPFVRQGLERGERCLYVLYDYTEEEVVEALRERGVDVDAALESGALTFHTVEETYLRKRPFDPEEMISFYADAVDETTAEYEGLRVIAGTNWIEEVSLETFMEYEGRVNALFEETDSMALCHYDRTRLSSEMIRDVIRTHPHLIYDGTVSHNFYYTPADELFGSDEPDREVDRMLGTLNDRARAKTELAEHKRFLQELNEITSSPDRSFEEKLHDLFDLGCAWFDLELGALNRVDPDADRLQVEYISGDHDYYKPGAEFPLSQTYCIAAADIKEAASVSNPPEEGFDDLAVYEEFGVESYLGTYIPVEGGVDRTFAFIAAGPRTEPFSEEDRTYLELMGQWVKYELERQQREQFLRECYEITSDPAPSFEEKLERLVEVGCERFGLDHGGLCRVDPESDLIEVETVVGDHDVLEPGLQAELSETYCQVPVDANANLGDAASQSVSVTDPEGDGFEGKLCYERFGIRAYLGTYLEFDGAPDRTFWFVSNEPRDDPITDEERMFHRLMGQWVKYELENQQYEQELEETIDRLQQSNDRLKQFAYAASHDLQEPLRMVSSYLQLLENQYEDDLDEEAQEYIDFAVDGADRMRAMVDDLLAYSRVEQSNGEFEPVECDALLDRVVTDLQVQIEDNDAEIAIESLPTVTADNEQLEQLFRNLVSNAIKYSGDEPPRVEITAEERTDHWEFAVTDNGIGIDPDKTDRIFEIFKRLHHEDEYSGTGIGLSLCQEIVENHGGDIWVESEPGEGSTFYFTLPQQRKE